MQLNTIVLVFSGILFFGTVAMWIRYRSSVFAGFAAAFLGNIFRAVSELDPAWWGLHWPGEALIFLGLIYSIVVLQRMRRANSH